MGPIKGGSKLIEKKMKEESFQDRLEKLKSASSKRMKKWHERMKESSPEDYCKMQYERYKKISDYEYNTERGEEVRNKLEKRVADYLYNKDKDYKYEPYLYIASNAFFPDFLYGDNIIECTSGKGYDKAERLKEKIRNYKNKGFETIIFIPQRLKKYYKKVEGHIETDLQNLPG